MKRLYYSFAYIFLLGIPAYFFYSSDRIDLGSLVLTIIIVFIIGSVFDIWAVRQGRKDRFFIWQYNEKSIIGLKIRGVPIEDYILFLVLTPIFIISLYTLILNSI